jgi:Double zinc ribbon
MSLQKEIGIIPKFAWAIAIVACLGVSVGLILIAIPQYPDTSNLPQAGKTALGLVAGTIPAIYILLLGYIYGDAKRRGMRYIVWTLLAVFVPNAIGIILYFVLRDPMPVFCSRCGVAVKSTFTFCPQCAKALRPTCLQCGHALERTWSHCPNCGAASPERKDVAAPSAQRAL